jgi:hypothetical protein
LVILYARKIVFHFVVDRMNQPKYKLIICRVSYHCKLTSLIESLHLPNQASMYDVCAQSIIYDQLKYNNNILTIYNETKNLYIVGEVAIY